MDDKEAKFPYSEGDPVHVRIDIEVKTWEQGEMYAQNLMAYAEKLDGYVRCISGVKYAKPEELAPIFWTPYDDEEEEVQELDPGDEVDDQGGMSERHWEGYDDRD